jgi:hypothetical protein
LSNSSDHGSNEWVCTENDKGWLGFRNRIAGNFLGRDINCNLCCSVKWHREWEKFRIRPTRYGYVLIMTHWGKLRPIGIKQEGVAKKLAMFEYGESDEKLWEFIEVK